MKRYWGVKLFKLKSDFVKKQLLNLGGIAYWILGGAFSVFLLGHIGARFIDAYIEQNDFFSDPNSIVAGVVLTVTKILTSPITTHIFAFVFGLIVVHLLVQLRILGAEGASSTGLDKILKDVDRIIKCSEIQIFNSEKRDFDKSKFEQQYSNILSLNLTLEKSGFGTFDIQNYSKEEFSFLKRLYEEVSILQRDNHFKEAKEKASTLLDNANDRMDRLDRTRRLRWIVDERGDLYCPTHDYYIEKERVHSTIEHMGGLVYEWPFHLVEKTWFELGPFLEAFKPMLACSSKGLDEDIYSNTIKSLCKPSHNFL